MAKDNYIFGTRAVMEAVGTDKQIDKVLIKKESENPLIIELLNLVKKNKIPFQFVPVQKINKITQKNHQGVLAFISPVKFYDIHEIVTRVFESGEAPFILALDGVTDVRNFGALVRTAESAGVHAVLVPEKNSARINADAVKTSAGAIHKIALCRTHSMRKTLEELKNTGLRIITADEKANKYYYDVDFTHPHILVAGAEDSGISKSIISISDEFIKIPMQGEIKSLNVSVAASILMYETVRQRIINTNL
jgi:23S rRNA (guanosine2251-2'-O)-methyltransferase